MHTVRRVSWALLALALLVGPSWAPLGADTTAQAASLKRPGAQGTPILFDRGVDGVLAATGLVPEAGSSLRVEASDPNWVLLAGAQRLGMFMGPGEGPRSLHCAALRFSQPGGVNSFTLWRAGVRNGASTPAWAARGYNAAGARVSQVGEGDVQSGSHLGFVAEPTAFVLNGPGIVRLEVCTHNSLSTFGAVPITALAVDPAPGGGPRTGTGSVGPPPPRGGVVPASTLTIPADGGTLRISEGPLDGLRIDVPPGALADDRPVELTVGYEADPPRTSFGDTIGDDGRLFGDLVRYTERLAANSDTTYHPVWYAALLAAAPKQALGPPIVLGPSGYQFQRPVQVTIPLQPAAGQTLDPATLVVLLGSEQADGSYRYEVVPDVQVNAAARTATISVTHFSRLIANALALPGRLHTLFRNNAQILREHEQRFLPDLETTYHNLLLQLACTGRPWRFNAANVPPIGDLLDHLGYHRGIPQARPPTALQTWVMQQANGSVTVEALLAKSLEFANDDIFQALLDAHNLLRLWREDPGGNIQPRLARFTRGQGADERGIRYHLFGTMLYGFAFEHYNATGGYLDVRRRIYDPDLIVTIEEGIVSGDIADEPEEWLADLHGNRLGQRLYTQVRTRSRDQLIADFGLDLSRCPQAPSAPSAGLAGTYRASGSSLLGLYSEIPGLYQRLGLDLDAVTVTSGTMELTVDGRGRVTGGSYNLAVSTRSGTGTASGQINASATLLITDDPSGIAPQLLFGRLEFQGEASACPGGVASACRRGNERVELRYRFAAAPSGALTGDLTTCNRNAGDAEGCASSRVVTLRR